jgi:hypothetical protein
VCAGGVGGGCGWGEKGGVFVCVNVCMCVYVCVFCITVFLVYVCLCVYACEPEKQTLAHSVIPLSSFACVVILISDPPNPSKNIRGNTGYNS